MTGPVATRRWNRGSSSASPGKGGDRARTGIEGAMIICPEYCDSTGQNLSFMLNDKVWSLACRS